MSRPDFIIIGAMKTGTTTLYEQLVRQPGIFMTTPKEPNFFSDDDVYAKGLGWYGSLFDGAGPGDLRGEASTHYTKLPTYPQTVSRLAAAVKRPRLIYVLRNPIDRAVSQYMHEASQGTVKGSFDEALKTRSEILDYGRYSMQIAPYIDAFGAGAIHLTSLELLKTQPEEELRQIGAFIGAAGPLEWHDTLAPQNTGGERFRPLPFHGLLVRNPIARALRRNLVPKALRQRVKDARSFSQKPEPSAQSLAKMEALYAEDFAKLIQLLPQAARLGASFPFAAS